MASSIIEECKKGNRWAQYQLYDLHAKAMYNVSLRIVGNTDEAEDIIQRAFIQAFAKLNKLQDEALFSAWLRKIVINYSLDKVRKKKVKIISLDDETNNTLEVASPFNGHMEVSKSTAKYIRESIALLPDGYRSILSLYLIEGYDHSEISEILGISESTSRSQYARAKLKLRDILKSKYKIEG